MTVLPVISRELRASARQPFTYHLRVLGVSALMLVSVLFGIYYDFASNLGGRLFGSLHFALFCSIWLLVPLLTADCISRERREGTLGLLFLTRLTAPDIVVAKGLAHGLRALTLWVAVVPVALIPIMQGGVSWDEALLSVLINFSAICWGLTAGLLASAWSKTWLRSLLRAAILSTFFLLALATGAGWVWTAVLTPGWMNGWQSRSDYAFSMGLGLLTDGGGTGNWADYLRLVSTGQLLRAIGQVALASLLCLVVAILVAGSKIRRSWQEQPASARQIWLQKTFCTPVVWISFFRRWLRRKLERNPIGWLEQRTWSGRLITWGWFAVIVSLYSVLLTDPRLLGRDETIHRVMAWLLTGSLAMSAAASFKRERETGVLELLLVSPLGESQIIVGRLRGLWGQFLPAFGVLLAVWLYFSMLFADSMDNEGIVFHAVNFLTLPIIGLYFSLRCRGFISAFLSTITVGFFVPVFLPGLLRFSWVEIFSGWNGVTEPGTLVTPANLLQLFLAVLCWFALHGRLKGRRFPLERAAA